MRCKFQPGDRVVNTSFSSPHEGIGGTVMQVQWIPNSTHPSSTRRGLWQVVVILDTAELLVLRQIHMWEHEQAYRDGSYIPF